MADTAWMQKNTVLSETLWQTALTYHPDTSPIPYYNLASTVQNAIEEKHLLETCLERFKSYYPAVIRYVRSVPETAEKTGRDPAEEMLKKAGFQTLEMEARLSKTPVSSADAHRVLAGAIADTEQGATSGGADIRFLIEDLRLTSREKPDIARTTAAIWMLLEQYPDDAVLHSYACWYFLSIKDLRRVSN